MIKELDKITVVRDLNSPVYLDENGDRISPFDDPDEYERVCNLTRRERKREGITQEKDDNGRLNYYSRDLSPDERTKLKEKLMSALHEEIGRGVYSFHDLDQDANGDWEDVEPTEFLGDDGPLYETMLDVQDDIVDLNPNFPIVVGDPLKVFTNRASTMDLIRTIKNAKEEIRAGNEEGFDKIVNEILDQTESMGLVDEDGDLTFNIRDGLADIVGAANEIKKFLKNGVPKGTIPKDFTDKIIKALTDGMERGLAKVDLSKLSPGGKVEFENLKNDIVDAINNIGNGTNLKEMDEKLKSIAEKLETIEKAAKERGIVPPGDKAGKHNLPPGYDRTNPPVSASDYWNGMTGYGDPENWPIGKNMTAYWKRYDELLGLIEQTKDTDKTKADLKMKAKKALVRGLLGQVDVHKVRGKDVYTIGRASQVGGYDIEPAVKANNDGTVTVYGKDKSTMSKDEYQVLLKAAAMLQSGKGFKDLDLTAFNTRVGLDRSADDLEREVLRKIISLVPKK